MGYNIKSTEIVFKGADEIAALFDEFPRQIAKRVALQSLLAAAKPFVTALKDNVPVRTGNLRKSINARKAQPGRYAPKSDEVKIIIGPRSSKSGADGFYGRFLEYGTRKMKPRPWYRPVFDSQSQSMKSNLAKEVKSRIEETALMLAAKRS